MSLRKLAQVRFVSAIAGWSQLVEKSGSIHCVNYTLECSLRALPVSE